MHPIQEKLHIMSPVDRT